MYCRVTVHRGFKKPLTFPQSQEPGATPDAKSHLLAEFAVEQIPQNLISLLLYSHFEAKVLHLTNI